MHAEQPSAFNLPVSGMPPLIKSGGSMVIRMPVLRQFIRRPAIRCTCIKQDTYIIPVPADTLQSLFIGNIRHQLTSGRLVDTNSFV